MAKYQTAADKAFNKQLREATKNRDWSALEVIFNQYGGYLELIEEPTDGVRAPRAPRIFSFKPVKRVS